MSTEETEHHRSKSDLSEKTEKTQQPHAERPLPPMENKGATITEMAAWWAVAVGAAVFLFALLIFSTAANSYSSDTSTPLLWMIIGGSIAVAMLVPAMLLTGIRSLLPDRRIS